MNKWQSVDHQRKMHIIENISKQTRLSPASIEKDWWVTMALSFARLHACTSLHH